VVYEGIDSYEERIHKKLENESLTARQIRFLKSLLNVIESMRIWHKRYSEVIEMGDMPFKKAENFKEAVQSLWFTFAFMRLCGDWPGIGRIDKILGPYLKKDLDQGVLTLDEAREILASFFIKGCEWIRGETPLGSGDAQHYQNIILAGVDEDNKEVANEVTYLVFKSCFKRERRSVSCDASPWLKMPAGLTTEIIWLSSYIIFISFDVVFPSNL
jgi:pyruvate-formate lyase